MHIPPHLVSILNDLDKQHTKKTRFYAHDNMCCPHNSHKKKNNDKLNLSEINETMPSTKKSCDGTIEYKDDNCKHDYNTKFINILLNLCRNVSEDVAKTVKQTTELIVIFMPVQIVNSSTNHQ